MKSRMAPRTAALSSTTSSQGLRALVISAKNYYDSPSNTIWKCAFFRLDVPPRNTEPGRRVRPLRAAQPHDVPNATPTQLAIRFCFSPAFSGGAKGVPLGKNRRRRPVQTPSRGGMDVYGFGEKLQAKKIRCYFALSFHRDGGGFGELERHPRPSGELGIVFLLLSGAVLGFIFVGGSARVGSQVTVDSIDDDGRENHL